MMSWRYRGACRHSTE